MTTKERLENIKENVYMRSEIAKFSGLGIDTSLREELELIEEIDRLNNIINELEKWLIGNKSGDISYSYLHTLNKLKELKDSD